MKLQLQQASNVEWTNEMVYGEFRNDELDKLPNGILIQMILHLEDKLGGNK